MFEAELLAPYEGIAVSVSGNCQPISIPFIYDRHSIALEAMRDPLMFVIVIWKCDKTAVTHVQSIEESLWRSFLDQPREPYSPEMGYTAGVEVDDAPL